MLPIDVSLSPPYTHAHLKPIKKLFRKRKTEGINRKHGINTGVGRDEKSTIGKGRKEDT